MKKGLLIILAGPSGVGKGTIYNRLLKELPNLTVSISVTTRQPRAGEVDGLQYYFRTKEQFDSMRLNGELLEWAQTFNNYYGTPKAAVLAKLEEGKDVLLEIDVKGAIQIEKSFPECLSIFILPPSEEELERRLRSRGTETNEQVNLRLQVAKNEILQKNLFDYSVVNDDIDKAVSDVIKIINKEKNI